MRTKNRIINTLLNIATCSVSYSTQSATWRLYPKKVVLSPTDKSIPEITYHLGNKHFYKHFKRTKSLGKLIHSNK